MSGKFGKILSRGLLGLTAAIGFSGTSLVYALNVDESPSYDGDFKLTYEAQPCETDSNIQSSQYTLTEYFTVPDGSATTTATYTVSCANGGEHEFSNKPSGTYDYSLEKCYTPLYSGQSCVSGGSTSLVVTRDDQVLTPDEQINLDDFDIYYGDLNNDGIDGDIYFHGRDVFVLLHGDIDIPLFIDGPVGFVYYRNEVGYFRAEPLDIENTELANYTQLQAGVDYFKGDLHGDGLEDLVIRGAYSGLPGLAVAAPTSAVYPSSHSLTFSNFDISDRSNVIVLEDMNADNRADIVLMSSVDGYILEIVYTNTLGVPSEAYYKAGNAGEMFNINTRTANTIGTLGGSFRVGESGAATYSIPILTPQGTAGVTPSVSLNYSSQGSDGMMGLGWTMSANSAISRCRQTPGIDNKSAGITFTSEDRFCFGGQRLLVVEGVYGAPGSKYRTEIDSQIIVTAVGGESGNPNYFTATAKDGSITYYGLTNGEGAGTDSKQVLASNNKTLTWYESVFEDNVGNPIKYFYRNEAGDNFRLKEINYAYGSGSAPNTRIVFGYEARPDNINGYVAGEFLETTVRLYRIDVFNTVASENNIRTYHITYNRELNNPEAKNRSLVAAIQACVGGSCQNASVFDWQISAGLMPSIANSYFETVEEDEVSLANFQQMDINGDGKMDVVWLGAFLNSGGVAGASVDNRLYYAVSSGDTLVKGQFAGTSSNYDWLEFHENGTSQKIRMAVLDYNVDGRQDLAVHRSGQSGSPNEWQIYLAVPNGDSATSWGLSANPISSGINEPNAVFIDFNGDGLTDLMGEATVYYLEKAFPNPTVADYRSSTFYRFNATGQANPWLGANEAFETLPSNFIEDYIEFNYSSMGDINGDGRADVIGIKRRKVKEYVGPYAASNYVGAGEDQLVYLLEQTDTGFQVKEFLGAQDDHQHDSTNPSRDGLKDIVPQIVDFNNDGLGDLILRKGTQVFLRLNTGNGFLAEQEVATIPIEDDLQIADYNNDGHADLIVNEVDIIEVGNATTTSSKLVIRYWSKVQNTFLSPVTRIVAGDEKSVHFFADVNGDGFTDYLSLSDAKLHTYLYDNGGSKNDVIVSINNGQGGITDISYEAMNRSSHYDRLDVLPTGTTETVCESILLVSQSRLPQEVCEDYTTYNVDDFYYALNKGFDLPLGTQTIKSPIPALEMNGPMYLVTSVESTAPTSKVTTDLATLSGNSGAYDVNTSTKSKISYFYTQARAQAGGRGFLGFRTLTSIDEQSGIITTTEYRQDFPFTGQPLSTKVYEPNSQFLLSESHSVSAIHGLPSNANSLVENGGTQALGPLVIYTSENYQFDYAVNSSSANDAELQVVNKTSTPVLCKAGASACPALTEAIDSQEVQHQVINSTSIDEYGNALETVVETYGAGLSQKITTTMTYGNSSDQVSLHGTNFTYAELGRLTQTEVVRESNGITEPAKVSTFTYYSDSTSTGHAGMIKEEIVLPAGALAENIKKKYEYDALGNTNKTITTGWDGESVVNRSAESFFDSTGRFVNYSVDGLGHQLSQVIARNEYGAPTTVNSPNGGIATTVFDSWGREVSNSTNAGNWSSTYYVACPNSNITCPSDAVTAVYKTGSASKGAISEVVYQDVLGRTIRAASLGFDGTYVYVDTEFDASGRTVRSSLPYFAGTSANDIAWTRNYFDPLGRVVKTYLPDGTTASISNSGYAVTTVNQAGQTKTELSNGLGQLVKTTDDNGTPITYAYNAEGQIHSVISHPDGNVTNITPEETYQGGAPANLCVTPTHRYEIVMCYDTLGRKTAMWDPDKGYWTYEYNAFGELIKQTNANGHYVVNRYDGLGRIIKRTDYRANGSIEGYTRTYYDDTDGSQPVDNAILKATAVIYTEGAVKEICDGTNLCTFTLFDELGRPEVVQQSMPNGELYETRTHYRGDGKVDSVEDVLSGLIKRNGTAISSGVKNHYNNYGFLERTTDLDGGAELFRTDIVNAQGQLTDALLSGAISLENIYHAKTGMLIAKRADVGFTALQDWTYEWDAIGNLKNRRNRSGGLGSAIDLQESYCYDNLNRLLKINANTLSQSACDGANSQFTYDSLGNTITKSGVGSYNYGQLGSNGHRAGPHALTSIVDGGVTQNFIYDPNGNMLNDGHRNITYATFDKPLSIATSQHTTNFKYDAGHSRYYREDVTASGTEKTWYLGNVEKVEKTDGTVKWRRSVDGANLYTYFTDANNNETSAVEKRVILKDHLGSTDLITNLSGTEIQGQSFDPWGDRRDANDWTAFSSTEKTNFDNELTNRGYTGHEMLDEVGLIHMNGRIYDPRIARFMQADPFVQSETDTQMLNRYSYLRNNPLNATDPSGYFAQILGYAAIGYATGQIAAAAHAPILSGVVGFLTCASGDPVGCSTAFSFGSTYGMTGDFSAAMKSSVFAGMQAGAMTAIGGHFAKAGRANEATALGGNDYRAFYLKAHYKNFGGNWLSGSEVAGQIASHAMVGGVVSYLQGGKFGHGFASNGMTKGIMGSISWSGKGGLAGTMGRTAIAGAIGGTISHVTGGKFGNGATMAAFAHWYNFENHEAPKPIPQDAESAMIGRILAARMVTAFGGWVEFLDDTGAPVPTLQEVLDKAGVPSDYSELAVDFMADKRMDIPQAFSKMFAGLWTVGGSHIVAQNVNNMIISFGVRGALVGGAGGMTGMAVIMALGGGYTLGSGLNTIIGDGLNAHFYNHGHGATLSTHLVDLYFYSGERLGRYWNVVKILGNRKF